MLLSHLHFDHAAGVSRHDREGNLVSTFPNADIYVQKQEWEDARAGRSTMSKTYLRSTFEPIAPQVKLVEGEETVLDDIRLRPRVGHTWGLQSIEFDDGQGTVCFPSDVMPTRNHVGAAYSMGYDMLPWENMRTKQHLLNRGDRIGLALGALPRTGESGLSRGAERQGFVPTGRLTPGSLSNFYSSVDQSLSVVCLICMHASHG